MEDSDPYDDREHAKAKHYLLEHYIKAYAMILGRSVQKLVFVDGFAGPWQSGQIDRLDTSFGLSMAALSDCAKSLADNHNKQPKITSIWIEADVASFEHLDRFAKQATSSRIAIKTINAQFQDSIATVVESIGPRGYAFVFVDPKGYKNLIEPSVLKPLLELPHTELLINYMWSHIKYALASGDVPGNRRNLERLYGDDVERLLSIQLGEVRESEALRAYENQLRKVCGEHVSKPLRILSYPIFSTFGQRFPKYYLVHATHSDTGLTTFADECEATQRKQNEIFFVANQRRREKRTGIADIFGAHNTELYERDNTDGEQEAWLVLLRNCGDSVKITNEVWADLLEGGRCLPSSLQKGFGSLKAAGILENCDSPRKRPKNHVHINEVVRRLR